MNNSASAKFEYIDNILKIKFKINDLFYEMHLTSWDKGVVIDYIVDGVIEADDNIIKCYGVNLLAILASDAGRTWYQTIPDDIGAKIKSFESATGYGLSIPTLILISRDKNAKELFINDQLLFWILITTAFEQKWDYRSVNSVCSLNKRAILDICCFADSKAFLKMINRMKSDNLDLSAYRSLHKETHKINYLKINHIKNLNLKLIALLNEYPFLYSAKFIHHYPGDYNVMSLRSLIKDLLSLARNLRIANPEKVLTQISDMQTLENLHDRWAEKLNNIDFEALKEIIFPPPPKKGNDDIIAIENAYELALEGRTQSHCVRSYQQTVSNGDYYVYKILAPERATLGLKRQGREWVINQIQLRSNNSPSEETVSSVHNWFYAD
jgi:hypothetical protein